MGLKWRRFPALVSGVLAVLFCGVPVSGAPAAAVSEAQAQQKEWKESPFLAERGGPKSAVTGESAGLEGFTLKGILWDPQAPTAILNDRVVGVGERVGNWKVMEIRKDRVILSDGLTTREISAQ